MFLIADFFGIPGLRLKLHKIDSNKYLDLDLDWDFKFEPSKYCFSKPISHKILSSDFAGSKFVLGARGVNVFWLGVWGARDLGSVRRQRARVSRQNQPKAAANHRFIRNLIRNRNNNRLTITETQKEIATRKNWWYQPFT